MVELHSEQLAGPEPGAPTLVLLHGWGASSAIWRDWLGRLRRRFALRLIDLPGFGRSGPAPADFDTAVDALAAQLPPQSLVLGWSLGGAFALALAARHPAKVRALITLATNPCFVQRPDWSAAMPAATFEAFYQAVAEDPAAGLKRFSLLQTRGDSNEKSLRRRLRELLPDQPAEAALLTALQWLRDTDLRPELPRVSQPLLALYGAGDALVPVAVAEEPLLSARARIAVDADSAHLPFLSHPEATAALIEEFVDTLPAPDQRKRSIASAFSRAATDYDRVAVLQQRIGNQMLAAFAREWRAPSSEKVIIDIGSGTGRLTRELAGAAVLGIDIAEGMVRFAAASDTPVHWLCADGEQLPLANASVDAVFSNLAIQWSENLPALFNECHRVLKPGGFMLVSTLGPATLQELRAAWAKVDSAVHVNDFNDRPVLEHAIDQNRLRVEWWREERLCLHYARARDLMRELKAIGAHNSNSGRPRGLTGKGRLRAVETAYESFRTARGQLPASYQVWMIKISKARNQ